MVDSLQESCLKSFYKGLTSVTLVAAKIYGDQGELAWALTAQRGVIGLSNGTTPEVAYDRPIEFALLPDGRLIEYKGGY